jgi:hypothetical protein
MLGRDRLIVDGCRLTVLAGALVVDVLALLAGRALALGICKLPDCLDNDWRGAFPLDTDEAV